MTDLEQIGKYANGREIFSLRWYEFGERVELCVQNFLPPEFQRNARVVLPLGPSLSVCDYAWSNTLRPYNIIVFSFAFLRSWKVLATEFSFDPGAKRKEGRLCIRNRVGPANSPVINGIHIFRDGSPSRGRPLVVHVSPNPRALARFVLLDDEGQIIFRHLPPPPSGLSDAEPCGRDYYTGAVVYKSMNGDIIGIVYP